MDDASPWIRETRLSLGMTQAELSARAGVSLATVQNVEAGTANPALSTLRRLLAALGLVLDVRPGGADWDALASLGLPLSSQGAARQPVRIDDLPELIAQAALELSDETAGAPQQRKRESLQALLLALSSHFPSVYRKWFRRAPLVNALLPATPSGRHIKLARIALARLATQL